MAAGWVKSLQCKSRAFEDVNPKQLLPSTSCRNSVQSLKDVFDYNSKPKSKPKSRPKPAKPRPDFHHKRAQSVKSKPVSSSSPGNRVRRTVSAPLTKCPDPFFPSLTELPQGHPSRNVVEIIFHTRWGPKGFSGRVDMVFKIHNMTRALTRFEEYRESVKVRSGPGSVRCVADGNEMMRFHCMGPTSSGVIKFNGGDDCGGISCTINGGKGPTPSSVCTYSGSGAAHDSAGGGKGRRAMLVCRVIAGRVSNQVGLDSLLECGPVEFDSVSGDNGELLVFDSRAVLPCFLVIYKL